MVPRGAAGVGGGGSDSVAGWRLALRALRALPVEGSRRAQALSSGVGGAAVARVSIGRGWKGVDPATTERPRGGRTPTSSRALFLDQGLPTPQNPLLPHFCPPSPAPAGPSSGTKGLMRGWEDLALPSTTSDTEGQGPQEGTPEAHPGSPRAFHFHFSLLNIGVTLRLQHLATALRCVPRYTQTAPQVHRTQPLASPHAGAACIPDNAQPHTGAPPRAPTWALYTAWRAQGLSGDTALHTFLGVDCQQ